MYVRCHISQRVIEKETRCGCGYVTLRLSLAPCHLSGVKTADATPINRYPLDIIEERIQPTPHGKGVYERLVSGKHMTEARRAGLLLT